ncbi:CoA transferase [Rhodococcus wratislaviensis]|uniref:CoA transferase n=1 Tax=Rhodococcus wratislaviensis NBRC 100605 TaxID=1219028 RepID=X0RCX2_RHOWR|nr:CoA transferase [Rhodococcus wratislaviensis]GAF48895.1 hypothetical protein RW1_062_00190 [Rhodococcus wratislaviensis NBRC 100605]
MIENTPLGEEMLVIDMVGGIAAGYCAKVLSDGGARVIKIEPPEGDPLRHRSASGAPVDPELGGLLFGYMAASAQSVVIDSQSDQDVQSLLDLVASADVIIWSRDAHICRRDELDPARLRAAYPHVTVLTMTPFGLASSWAAKPANHFTLEAMSGGAWARGGQEFPPVMCGGDLRSYTVGALAALAVLLSWHRTVITGQGDLIDLAELDAMQLVFSFYSTTFSDAAGRPWRPKRQRNLPDIHRTKDGYVSIWVTTGQQWLDCCVLFDRQDWADDPSLGSMDVRGQRSSEMRGYIDEWCSSRTTAEIVDFATALRVPAAEVGNGATLSQADHLRERNMVYMSPATGRLQPDVPYVFHDGAVRRKPTAVPRLGEHTETVAAMVASGPESDVPREEGAAGRPMEGVRIADLTAFMAGPIVTQFPAFFGADVIHVESPGRPDGFRAAALRPLSQDKWWESSPFFLAVNTNKRDVAVDLSTDEGKEVMRRLAAECDVLVENYSPRVMGQLGFSYEELSAINPGLIMVRAPGFGLTGPWRDRPAYAPTVDAGGGGAWVTGFPEANPDVNNATFDALGGVHAAIAMLLALEYRRRTGKGMLVECPQVCAALVTSGAEQILEYDANGVTLERVGNRSWVHAPQGIYQVSDVERDEENVPNDDWVAISIDSDERWEALASLLSPNLAADASLSTASGRLDAQDRLDAAISTWLRDQDGEDAVATLQGRGIPASRVVLPQDVGDLQPVAERGFWEPVRHETLDGVRVPGFPARFASEVGPWHRTTAPSLGADNADVLGALLGYSRENLIELEKKGVIGEETAVMSGW